MEYIPYRKDEVDPGLALLRVPAAARLHRRPRRHPRDRRLAGREHRRVPAAGAARRRRRRRVDRGAGPWCTGHVNMMGISYGGFTALQVASHAPAHLTSIIPIDFTDDRYTDDCHYRGGLLRMYYDVGSYGTRMVAWNAMPPDPEWSDDWAEVWEEHLAGNEPYLLEWFRHQIDSDTGATARSADGRRAHPLPGVPDRRLARRLPEPAAAAVLRRCRCPKKVLIGPWDHRPPDVAVPGPRIDHLHEVVRWLDHWCDGERERRDGRAAGRRVHAGGRAAGRRPPRVRGRLARRDGLAGRPARPSACCTCATDGALATADRRRRRRRAALRPDRRRDEAGSGRAASSSGCPATSGRTRRSR